nr:Chain C, 10-mer peptide from Protein Nef [Human immunodeficiency virus 1]3VXP_F Chain F, 10-mer peptide from Protein Nef [Human immunodeficiency virus 1]3VXS_C Chain C, 10-mer peptide from Protein Nef [Human immunodeficiency virus 1]
RYPLTLGWCF